MVYMATKTKIYNKTLHKKSSKKINGNLISC